MPEASAATLSQNPPTYGELLGSAVEQCERAIRHGSGPFSTGKDAQDALVAFERFLGVLGRHARLLAAPGCADLTGRYGHGPELQELLQRLTDLDISRAGPCPWLRASDLLAAAHDVLTTHVGAFGRPRTPDGELLADPAVRRAATARLLNTARRALGHCGGLFLSTAASTRNTEESATTRARVAHVRQVSAAVSRLVAAQQSTPVDETRVLTDLDALSPVVTPATAAARSRDFDSSVAALTVLRLLSFRQADGTEHASPGCLHDLARLAVSTTRSADQWLPEPTTPVGRVQRAAARDELRRAGDAWQVASDGLGQQVLSLRKAPRLYADAIGLLLDAPKASVGLAVLAALPRLGMDAGATITRLSTNVDLVAPTREVGRFQATWKPIDPARAAALADRFTAAGRASHRAHIASVQVQRPRPNAATLTTPPPARSRRLGRDMDTRAATR